MTEDPSYKLRRNSFLYEACLRWVEKMASGPEACLAALTRTAILAWDHHPGRFADGALENRAFDVGRQGLPIAGDAPIHWESRRASTSLHVATALYLQGGHTRVLARWITGDVTANHGVVLTGQTTEIPGFFEGAVTEAGGTIIRLPPNDPVRTKAGALRAISAQFDRVILHVHPHDPVPVVAFAEPGGPPVAMFNHAHFGFSIGPSVADIVVSTLDYTEDISSRFRFAKSTTCLTGVPGLATLTLEPVDKDAAKARLGIAPSNWVAIVTAGDAYFVPNAEYDFFRTALRLLAEQPSLHLLVVGVSADSSLIPPSLRNESRCHFVGRVIDPLPYYRAADVCLESFPMPSLASVIEAVAYGEALPIPVYGRNENIVRLSLAPVLSYAYRPTDEADYLKYIGQVLLRMPESREQARQARMLIVSEARKWGPRLSELNRKIDQLHHNPTALPNCPMINSEDCRVMADLRTLDLGGQIDRLLPFGLATRTHIAAVKHGFYGPGPDVLAKVGRRLWRSVTRRQLQA